MFTPRMLQFLRDHYAIFSTRPSSPPYHIYMSLVWISSAFLLALQWYWGYLIFKGLLRTIVPGSSKNKNDPLAENGKKRR